MGSGLGDVWGLFVCILTQEIFLLFKHYFRWPVNHTLGVYSHNISYVLTIKAIQFESTFSNFIQHSIVVKLGVGYSCCMHVTVMFLCLI